MLAITQQMIESLIHRKFFLDQYKNGHEVVALHALKTFKHSNHIIINKYSENKCCQMVIQSSNLTLTHCFKYNNLYFAKINIV